MEHDWFPRPLPGNVAVGARSWIYSSFAFVHFAANRARAARIGNDTGIYNGTFFDLGPDAEVVIGDFCTLVGAIIQTNGRVEIGDYSFIAHEVVIAGHTIAAPPPNSDPQAAAGRNQPADTTIPSAPIRLAANCWVGMRAVLLAGADLGEGCIVGAGAVVNFPAPPHSIIAGNPARIVGSTTRSA